MAPRHFRARAGGGAAWAADRWADERRIRRMLMALALLGGAWGGAARAAPAEEARRLYEAFAAQNAHGFAAVRATLLESPRFLWVSERPRGVGAGCRARPYEGLPRERGLADRPGQGSRGGGGGGARRGLPARAAGADRGRPGEAGALPH